MLRSKSLTLEARPTFIKENQFFANSQKYKHKFKHAYNPKQPEYS